MKSKVSIPSMDYRGDMQVSIYEYWVNDYERILLIEEDDAVVVSIDVFCPKWSFDTYSTHAVSIGNEITIFYGRVNKEDINTCFHENLEWIEYVGIKVLNEKHTQLVNIRLKVKSKGLNIDEITNIAKCIKGEVEKKCSV